MGDRAQNGSRLDEKLLEHFRWRPDGLSSDISIWVAPTKFLLTQGFGELAPEDESGAMGLLIAALCARFTANPQSIEFYRPQPTAGLFSRPRPGYALITNREGRRKTARRVWTSLSRTDELVAVGIGTRKLGIDVERLQSPRQSEDLLSLMHPHDRTRVQSCSGLDRQCATTALWTRIEAVAKLRGTGLRNDPASLRVGASNSSEHVGRMTIVTVGSDELGQLGACSTNGPNYGGSSVPDYVVSVAHW